MTEQSVDNYFKDLRNLLHRFDAVIGANDAESELIDEIVDKIRALECEHRKTHDFIHDQCGYWQHQFCCRCMEAKYPDMAGKLCSQLSKEMGQITEEEFTKRQRLDRIAELAEKRPLTKQRT